MKLQLKILFLLLCLCSLSCQDDDVEGIISCDGNCNVFTGRVYRADNVGLANVTLKVFHQSSGGLKPSQPRLVGRTKTDQMGKYVMEGFIKNDEFIYGGFYITIDEAKVESLLTSNFLKPSEIYKGPYDITNLYHILDLETRTQVVTADYVIPYKATITVNLNDFNPTSTHDTFGVGNAVVYGFSTNRVLTKLDTGQGFGFANGINSTFTIPAIVGNNDLSISRFENGLTSREFETIIIDASNNSPTISYSF